VTNIKILAFNFILFNKKTLKNKKIDIKKKDVLSPDNNTVTKTKVDNKKKQ
jgi:hypothetical protein